VPWADTRRTTRFEEPMPAVAAAGSQARMSEQAALNGDLSAARRSICKFWQAGSCREAPGQCTFAHGEQEIGTLPGVQLPEPTVRRSICKFWQSGSCREAPGQCTFAHGEHEIGTAPGAMPRSHHRGEAVLKQSAAPVGAPGGHGEDVRRSICKFWLAGSCNKAQGQCTFAHGEHEIGTAAGVEMPRMAARSFQVEEPVQVRLDEQEGVRRTICKFWQSGACSKAPGQCTFAHGEHEIGTAPGQMRPPPNTGSGCPPSATAFRSEPRSSLPFTAFKAAPLSGGDEQEQARRTICKFWLAGNCSKAHGQCSFAHGEHEIGTSPREMRSDRLVPRNGTPALAALPAVAAGVGVAPVRRTLCRFFQSGQCEKAPGQCLWAHGAEEIGTVVGALPRRGETRTPCKFHASGFCSKGLACPFAHILEEDGSGAAPWPSAKRMRFS